MPTLMDGRLGFALSPDPTWHLIRSEPHRAVWELDGARLKLTHRAAALLTDPFLLRSFRQDLRLLAAERGGGLISAELVPCGVLGLVKLPQRGLGRGVTIEGRLLIPLERGHVEVIASADEGAKTGVREAEVLMHRLPTGGGVPPNWLADPYDHVPAAPSADGLPRPPQRELLLLRCLSDDAEFDVDFPDHPLSRVRRLLSDVQRRATVTESATLVVPRGRTAHGDVRFFLPLGFLKAQELPSGATYERVSFDGRLSRFRIARREDYPTAGRDLAVAERLVAAGLERLGRPLRAGPLIRARRIGSHTLNYAEVEWDGVLGPQLAASAFVPWRSGPSVEVTRVGHPDDWARIEADLAAVVSSLGTFDQGPPRISQVSPNGRRRIYRILCWLAHCDGDVPRSERRILDSFRSRCGIDPVDAARLEGQAVAEVALPVGANQAERDQLAASMLAIVTADGVLDPSEQTRTTALANLLGFPSREWLSFLQDGLEA